MKILSMTSYIINFYAVSIQDQEQYSFVGATNYIVMLPNHEQVT